MSNDGESVRIEWSAPLELAELCRKEPDAPAMAHGVYLWLYPERDSRVVYVGSTRRQNFQKRIEQEVQDIFGLSSHFFYSLSGAELYGKLKVQNIATDFLPTSKWEDEGVYAPLSLERICSKLSDAEYHKKRAEKASEYLSRCRFCLGQTPPDADHLAVEGTIGNRLRNLYSLGAPMEGKKHPRSDDCILGRIPKGRYAKLIHDGAGAAIVRTLLKDA